MAKQVGNLIGPSIATKVADQSKILKDKDGKARGYVLWLDFLGRKGKAICLVTGDVFGTSANKVNLNNRTIDESLIQKLKSSRIGTSGAFYLTESKETKQPRVTAFTGIVVSEDVTVKGKVITFRFEGKVFRGHIHGTKLFVFKRVK